MAILSNSINTNTSAGSDSSVSATRRASYRSGKSTLNIAEGQTLKGVVSDVHGNKITLSMDDGTSFTGQLPDANQYSIGQKAAFQITSLENNTIYMKTLTGAYLLDIDDTIEQALEEANLPKSPRNLEVVKSLLQNQQSISRENILSSIRLAAQFPQAQVNTVITMKRLNYPMDENTVKQFQNYSDGQHQLLNKMDSLTDSLNDMLTSIGQQVPRLSKQVADNLLSIALEGEPSPEEVILKESQIQAESDSDISAENPELAALEEEVTQTDEASQLSDNTNGPFSRLKQLVASITDGNAAATSAMTESGITNDYKTPFINEQTGFILSPEERQEFSEFLKDFPISDEIKEKLSDGSITARDFLESIKEALPKMSDEKAGQLISSKGFQAILKGQFISDWTISPEHLKDEGAMRDLYEKMEKQFNTLTNFNENILGKDIFNQITNNANDMTNNLDFMKLMNDAYQYIQLPLKLQNQNAHGDLYVMTRKEALKKHPDKLKVLLHLDMDNLGSLDIHISKENTAVDAQFFVSSQQTKALLEKNIELLQDAINEQGYAFTSQLSLKEKDVDVVKDFICADAPVGDFKRYNFDLRA